MKDDLFNDIASLLRADPPPGVRDKVLRTIGVDLEVSDTLLLTDYPGLREQLHVQLPFEIPDTLAVGTHNEYFRVLDPQGIRLGKRANRLSIAVKRISSGELPLCLKRRLDVEADLAPVEGPTKISIRYVEGSYQLLIEPECGMGGHLELWKNGKVMRAIPVHSLFERPISGLETGDHVALRHSSASTGIGFVLVPVEFGAKEWRSACLVNALMGNIPESMRLLTTEVANFVAHDNLIGQICRRMEALGALTKSEQSVLVPVPAVRSNATNEEDRVSVFRLVWEGIVRCWPEAKGLPNPWGKDSQGTSPTRGILEEGVEDLIQATVKATRIQVEPEVNLPTASDLQVRAGWAALRGWDFLLRKDFQNGMAAFSSVPATGEDPFGLAWGVFLAQRLQATSETTDSEEQAGLSDEVWKNLFSGAL